MDSSPLTPWDLQHNHSFSFTASSNVLSGSLTLAKVSCNDYPDSHCLAPMALLIFLVSLMTPESELHGPHLIWAACLRWRLAPGLHLQKPFSAIPFFFFLFALGAETFLSLFSFTSWKKSWEGSFPEVSPSFHSRVELASFLSSYQFHHIKFPGTPFSLQAVSLVFGCAPFVLIHWRSYQWLLIYIPQSQC